VGKKKKGENEHSHPIWLKREKEGGEKKRKNSTLARQRCAGTEKWRLLTHPKIPVSKYPGIENEKRGDTHRCEGRKKGRTPSLLIGEKKEKEGKEGTFF